MTPQELLRHHVTGAIERGEKEAIAEQTKKETINDALRAALIYTELKIEGFLRDYPEHHAMVQTPLRLKAQLEKALRLA